jgi:hypothetical protein
MMADRPDTEAGEQQNSMQANGPRKPRKALSHELLHGLTPQEFNEEARKLDEAEAITPKVRARLKAQLVERLKTPVDKPSWGPDWVKHGEKVAAPRRKPRGLAKLWNDIFSKNEDRPWGGQDDEEESDEAGPARKASFEAQEIPHPLSAEERDDSDVIMRNMEKSRQVAHYRPLYGIAVVLALGIALLAMFVDYQIIRGDVWTRALSNEFMVVPASLKASVVFKSLQVLFAVLIVHFMLKITGVYGRNTLIVTSFLFAVVMVGCLGYLVAYNNMAGGTSTQLEQRQDAAPQSNAIERLFTTDSRSEAGRALPVAAPLGENATSSEYSLPLPRISQASLANTDSWVWLAFASVIFFIVTTVAALYLQTVENNLRNFHIASDYRHRQRQFAQLHLLELADKKQS